MSDSERHSGIPTRAIHEAYLDMQRALKQYRQARDRGSQPRIERAHGDVQESVLTLYEMLRPHIKHNDAVTDYWEGELPSYPSTNGDVPDPEDGKAVLQVQNRYDTFEIPREQWEETADLTGFEDWHDFLELNGNIRLTGVEVNESGVAVVALDAYQLGLRNLDNWQTEYRTEQSELGGFLGGTEQTRQTRERVGMPKLKRAARELADVSERLGLHARTDVDALPVDEL